MTIELKDINIKPSLFALLARAGHTTPQQILDINEVDFMKIKGTGAAKWQALVAARKAVLADEGQVEAPATPADPSRATYDALLTSFQHFNETLFESRLPEVMLVLQRKRNTHGYFWAEQWRGRDSEENFHEIALNPETMGRTFEEVLSTLVHEMTHLEQQVFGKPGKNGYHNKAWGELMVRVGLQPRGVGKCTGKTVGKHISHDIVADGPFATECAALKARGVDLTFITNSFDAPKKKKADRSKVKHTCPECDANIWCKEDLHMICGECNQTMLET